LTKLSIRNLIVGVILVLGISVIALTSLWELQVSLNQSEQRSREQLQTLMTDSVALIEENNRFGATRTEQNLLRRLSRYRAITAASAIDPDNIVRHSTSYVSLGNSIDRTDFADQINLALSSRANQSLIIERQGDTLLGVSPVAWTLLPGELLPSRNGVLMVRYDMAEEIANSFALSVQRATVAAIMIALFSWLAGWFFQRTLGRDIEELVRTAQEPAGQSARESERLRLAELQAVQGALLEANALIGEQVVNLETSEKRFRDIVESSAEWIFESDSQWRISYSNQASAQILGRDPSELVGLALAELLEQSPENLHAFAQIKDAHSFTEQRLRLLDSEGVTRELLLTGHQRKGQVRAVCRDVTETRKMQEALMHSQKMDAVGQLAGAVAHDFKNFLSVILARCEIALLSARKGSIEANTFEQIRERVMSAAHLTQRLVALARQDMPAPVNLNINDEINKLKSLMQSAAGEQVVFTFDLDSKLPSVRFDPVQIEQVLLNLTLNARNAMGQGGEISIGTRFKAAADGSQDIGTVQLSFSDTGSGMSGEVLDRLFDPFFTTRKGEGGTGLGLASVYTCVQNAGGDISVNSELDKGSSFLISLPALSGVSVTPAQRRDDSVVAGSGHKVLVVDDVSDLRELLFKFLNSLGFQTISAPDFATAKSLLDEHQFDLVLTDIVLPDGNGIDLVREHGQIEQTIFMSGHADSDIIEGIDLELGVNFLNKPFRLTELSQIIARALKFDVAQPQSAG
jgi:PAS domain S-box-containing protein